MDYFSRIRNFIFNLHLRSKTKSKKDRSPVALTRAKRIGILFQAENIRANDMILEFAQQLKSTMKDVQLLGYLPKREFGFVYPFPFITSKDTTWYGKPGGGTSGFFMRSPFDLIINFCPEECLPLEYITALSPSQFRVGFNPEANIANYDLILISKEKSDISKQIKNLEHYLK
jgi:hypothetical protein